MVLSYLKTYRKEVSKLTMSNTRVSEIETTKICKKCGRILPIEKFRLVKGQFYNPYYLSQCKECEYKYQRKYLEEKNKIEFTDNLEMLFHRHCIS